MGNKPLPKEKVNLLRSVQILDNLNKMGIVGPPPPSFLKRLAVDRPSMLFGMALFTWTMTKVVYGEVFGKESQSEYKKCQHKLDYTVIRKGYEDPNAVAAGVTN